jgi:hypothetical protein
MHNVMGHGIGCQLVEVILNPLRLLGLDGLFEVNYRRLISIDAN